MTDPWSASKDVVHTMQDQLARLRANAASQPAAPPEPVVGTGEALDGHSRVEATLDAARTATAESLPTPPSLDQMTRVLGELSTDSLRAADQAAEGIRQSMAAIQRISQLHRKQP